jgi:anti-sigma factor RsiW
MVSCETVLEELSNFIDGDVDPVLRAEIQAHIQRCHRCSVLVDSMSKMVYIFADEKVIEVPSGYSERLHRFIDSCVH